MISVWVAASAGQTATIEMNIGGLRVVDLSPDDKHLAALVFEHANSALISPSLQLWDLQNSRLVHNRDANLGAFGRIEDTPHVRYSADGNLIAVYAGMGAIRVFRASNLQQLCLIQTRGRLSSLEFSPATHSLAVRYFVNGRGDVRIYDGESGRELRGWTVDKGSFQVLAGLSGMSWRSDGTLLAISAPDRMPCATGGGTIVVYDPQSDTPSSEFRVRFLPGDVAFGDNDALYVANMTCGGYFAHHTTALSIFNIRTGKQIGEIPAAQVGIRRTISISHDRRTLLAYADREKTVFELEDSLKTADSQWQVLDTSTHRLLFTIPGQPYEQAVLSMSGQYLLTTGQDKLRIFRVRST